MTILDKTLTTTWAKTIATTTLGMAMTVGAPVGISMLTMSSAQAAPASEATAAKNLNKLLTNVKSMSANFTQTTTAYSSSSTPAFCPITSWSLLPCKTPLRSGYCQASCTAAGL